jgi:hypothetical protein
MSENDDVILAALTERMFQELGERGGDSAAALVFSVGAMASVIRSRQMTIDEALRLIDDIFSLLPAGYRTDKAAERLGQATDWLRAYVPGDEFAGKTIDSTAQPPKRKR